MKHNWFDIESLKNPLSPDKKNSRVKQVADRMREAKKKKPSTKSTTV